MQGESLTRAWLCVLAALLAVTAALWGAGMRVNFGVKGLVLFWGAAVWLFLSLRLQSQREWAKRVLLFGNGLLLFSAMGLCGGLATYWITAVTNFPFADELLYRADLMVGLDWRAIYHVYRELDWLPPIMQRLYLAIFYTPLLVLLGLAATGQDGRIRLLLMATAITLGLTVTIHAFLPAKTALLYLVGTHPPYVPVTGLCCTEVINDLRSGYLDEIRLEQMYGLVTFPSFHAATAVLLSWACWTMRLYRWPIAVINAGMLVATPLEGGHYFVDLAGGAWVAAASIYVARALAAADILARFPLPGTRRGLRGLPDRS